MTTDVSYFEGNKAYHSRSNYKEVFTSMLNNIRCTDVNLGFARSCLAIGPCDGKYEVEFINHCASNVSKLLAVEPDNESVKYLRGSLGTSLPGVKSRVFETTLQKWKGVSDPVDLILMFQCLYYFQDDERKELFKKMHDQWLTSGGCMAISMRSRQLSPSIGQFLGVPCPQWEDIVADLENVGFTKLYEYDMHVVKDFSHPDDESLHKFYQLKGKEFTLDRIRRAVKEFKELIPNGQAHDIHTVAVFKRTD